jgi:mRNA-degrading endonuclease RelE of RelBE toxin-antitoxin system
MAERFAIVFSASAKNEFDALKTFDQRRVADAITAKLIFGPELPSHGKKNLGNEPANFTYVPPLWELRVAEWRVFYTASLDDKLVLVCGVRRKPPNLTTSQVLNEENGD